MLEHIGEGEAAARLRDAVYKVLQEGKHITRDLGGSASTTEMTKAIIDAL
jgi:isocitrate dehydrogenase (NAD+)